MWYSWSVLLLVSCALVTADSTESGTEAQAPLATTHSPRRTLDRKAAELAWKSWLQSPESGSQNAPARRITTKSLFITPLVCPKGQRLDRNGCVQLVTVNKDEHERTLLEQLNALFTAPPSGDELYDYGDQEAGPLQLSIPIGLDPQAAPLQGQEPAAQAPNLQFNNIKVDKKDGNATDASIEAELELLKLQNTLQTNDTEATGDSDGLNVHATEHNPDKPKRDSTGGMLAELKNNFTDVGQKELVFGHVDVDPLVYNIENETADSEQLMNLLRSHDNATTNKAVNNGVTNITLLHVNENRTDATNSSTHAVKPDEFQNKLKPENDYGDIGEAIKLISRYADVTTDDNFAKERNKLPEKDESVLGTRTKIQYRRNKPKEPETIGAPTQLQLDIMANSNRAPVHNINPNTGTYYRYPWQSQQPPKPPADYPFRHLQDYWPGRTQVGGVYNTHENPRRHHHSYPHNFRLHGYPHGGDAMPPVYPEQVRNYIRRAIQRHGSQLRSDNNHQDLYNLLDLRHWFSSEGTSNR